MSKAEFNPVDHPHRRYNPPTVSDSVSPHRAKRLWSGQDEKPSTEQLPEYEKECFLCSDQHTYLG
ncbi:hypothetical protein O9993_10100 [Vibrio lentus]|nr:hypothetical protein [Vibrio lentus]